MARNYDEAKAKSIYTDIKSGYTTLDALPSNYKGQLYQYMINTGETAYEKFKPEIIEQYGLTKKPIPLSSVREPDTGTVLGSQFIPASQTPTTTGDYLQDEIAKLESMFERAPISFEQPKTQEVVTPSQTIGSQFLPQSLTSRLQTEPVQPQQPTGYERMMGAERTTPTLAETKSQVPGYQRMMGAEPVQSELPEYNPLQKAGAALGETASGIGVGLMNSIKQGLNLQETIAQMTAPKAPAYDPRTETPFSALRQPEGRPTVAEQTKEAQDVLRAQPYSPQSMLDRGMSVTEQMSERRFQPVTETFTPGERIGYGAIGQVAQLPVIYFGGLPGLAISAYGGSEREAMKRQVALGVDPNTPEAKTQRNLYAFATAAVEAGTEAGPVGNIIKAMSGKASGKLLMKQMLEEFLGEGTSAALEPLIAKSTIDKEMDLPTMTEYLANIAEQGATGAISAVLMMGASYGVGSAKTALDNPTPENIQKGFEDTKEVIATELATPTEEVTTEELVEAEPEGAKAMREMLEGAEKNEVLMEQKRKEAVLKRIAEDPNIDMSGDQLDLIGKIMSETIEQEGEFEPTKAPEDVVEEAAVEATEPEVAEVKQVEEFENIDDDLFDEDLSEGEITVTPTKETVKLTEDVRLVKKEDLKDSIIRDDKGELIKLYHGTSKPFIAFDKRTMGEFSGAKSAEEGFFFTDTKDVAETYRGGEYDNDALWAYIQSLNDEELDQVLDDSRLSGEDREYIDKKSLDAITEYDIAEGIDWYADFIKDVQRNTGGNINPELWKNVVNEQKRGHGVVAEVNLDMKNPKEIKDFDGDVANMTNEIQQAKAEGYDGLIVRKVDDSAKAFDQKDGIYSDVYIVFDPSQIYIDNFSGNVSDELVELQAKTITEPTEDATLDQTIDEMEAEPVFEEAEEDLFDEEPTIEEAEEVAEVEELAEPTADFNESVVRDDKGDLLTVYHGTSVEQAFDKFDTTKEESHGRNSAIKGIWFTSTKENAGTYASKTSRLTPDGKVALKPMVIPVQLDMKNPYVFDIETDGKDFVGGNLALDKKIAQEASAGGHDGIIIKNRKDPMLSDQYVVFSPDQIKMQEPEYKFPNYSNPKLLFEDIVGRKDTDMVEAERASFVEHVKSNKDDFIKGALKLTKKDLLELAPDVDSKLTKAKIADAMYNDIVAEVVAVEESVDTAEVEVSEAKTAEELTSEAIEVFGETDDYYEAGYVMPDGTMLDFSGKRDGGPSGVRYMDHREVEELYPDWDGSQTEALIKFMEDTGAVRMDISDDSASINIHGDWSPDSKQKRIIKRASAGKQFVTIEYDPTGSMVPTVTRGADFPTNAEISKMLDEVISKAEEQIIDEVEVEIEKPIVKQAELVDDNVADKKEKAKTPSKLLERIKRFNSDKELLESKGYTVGIADPKNVMHSLLSKNGKSVGYYNREDGNVHLDDGNVFSVEDITDETATYKPTKADQINNPTTLEDFQLAAKKRVLTSEENKIYTALKRGVPKQEVTASTFNPVHKSVKKSTGETIYEFTLSHRTDQEGFNEIRKAVIDQGGSYYQGKYYFVTDSKVDAEAKQQAVIEDMLAPEPDVETLTNESKGPKAAYASIPKLIPQKGIGASETVRLSDASRIIEKALKVPVRKGKFRQRALGIFKEKGVVRLKNMKDMNVLMHEVGHYFDKHFDLYNKLTPAMKAELTELGVKTSRDTYTKKEVQQEGIAEFFSYYLQNKQLAYRMAPLTYDLFNETISSDQVTSDMSNELNDMMQQYLEMDASQKVLSNIHLKNSKKPNVNDVDVSTLKNKLYTAIFDSNHPIFEAARDIIGDINSVPPSINPMTKIRLSATSGIGKLESAMERGLVDPKTNKFRTKGFYKIIAPIQQAKLTDEFVAYAASKRALELEERGIQTGMDMDSIKEVAKQYSGNNTREARMFNRVLNDLYNYQDTLLDIAAENDLISEDSLKGIKEVNRFYVPFNRVLDASYKMGDKRTGSTIKKIVGSEKDIVNPLESIIRNTYAIYNAIDKNSALQSFFDLEKIDGSGKYFDKVPSPMQAVEIEGNTLGEIMKSKYDVDLGEQIDKLTIFKPGQYPGKENVVAVLRDGKYEYYEIHNQDLFNSITNNWGFDLGILGKALGVPAKMLRAGATEFSDSFMLRNFIRDTISASIYSKSLFVPVVDSVRGVFMEAGKSDLYYQALASGALNNSVASIDRDYIKKDTRKLYKRDIKEGVLDNIKQPLEVLRGLNEAVETSTRMGEFRKAYNKNISNGMAHIDAVNQAALDSRDLMDFMRAGWVSKEINRIIPFFNATLQGSDKLLRSFKEDKAAMIVKAAPLVLFSIALKAMNDDDERYERLSRYTKDMYWIIPIGDTIVKIPKPHELGLLFGSTAERSMEYLKEKDPKAYKGFVRRILEGFLPQFLPQAFKPLIENATNYSFFYDGPIVPRSQEFLPEAQQFGTSTSEVAKELGKALDYSPRKIDNLVRGYVGTAGSMALNAVDGIINSVKGEEEVAEPAQGFLGDTLVVRGLILNPYTSSVHVEDYYDYYNDIKEEASSMRNRGEEYPPKFAAEYKRANKMNRYMASLNKATKYVKESKKMDSDRKAEMLIEIQTLKDHVAIATVNKKTMDRLTSRKVEQYYNRFK